ncbi:hypothetical protein L208DRAFT_1275361 [Tricholoma matsutake]|nr:hypothetical protein L208DRAFT_1275361 [Tricholoma matsutake 945]
MIVDDNRIFLGSVEGEISFFRSIMRARPIGIHRHFHVLAIQRFIQQDTGRIVHTGDIWDKLRSCYNLDALEAIDLEAEAYELSRSNGSTPSSVRSPSPSADLSTHPYFREEFSLPPDEPFELLTSQRRLRATASTPSSSPAPSPAVVSKPRGGKKRGRTKLDMAGLVGGDSDSSALTQESGDEGTTGTGRLGSVITGTDGGTDYAEDEDVEMHQPSPARSASPKATRHRSKAGKRRGRPPAGSTMTRATKKRKR